MLVTSLSDKVTDMVVSFTDVDVPPDGVNCAAANVSLSTNRILLKSRVSLCTDKVKYRVRDLLSRSKSYDSNST